MERDCINEVRPEPLSLSPTPTPAVPPGPNVPMQQFTNGLMPQMHQWPNGPMHQCINRCSTQCTNAPMRQCPTNAPMPHPGARRRPSVQGPAAQEGGGGGEHRGDHDGRPRGHRREAIEQGPAAPPREHLRHAAAQVRRAGSPAMPQCPNVPKCPMHQCTNATMHQCNNATLQHCNNATMQQCNNATMQQCTHRHS